MAWSISDFLGLSKEARGVSKELRGLSKLFQNAQNIKKMDDFAIATNRLQQALTGLNREMKEFNQNIKKSNVFLDKIAKLQTSADRTNWILLLFAGLQIIIVIAPYVAKYLLHWQI